jgi:hypothetical protein
MGAGTNREGDEERWWLVGEERSPKEKKNCPIDKSGESRGSRVGVIAGVEHKIRAP